MGLAAVARRLRDAERAAREVLERGCAEDLSSLEHIVARPLQKARAELETRDVHLWQPSRSHNVAPAKSSPMAASGSELAFRCTHRRWQMPSDDFSSTPRRSSKRTRRACRDKITLPRIGLRNDWTIVPQCNRCSIGEWFAELRKAVCRALEREVDRSRRVLLERGAASLIRTRVVLRLALHGPIEL